MIDRGLVLTLVAMAATVLAVARLAPPRTGSVNDLIDPGIWAVFTGILVGRATALLLDDPSGLARLSDFVIIRGGVELWPGVAAGTCVAIIAARRAGVAVLSRLADLAPYGLCANAVYEAACVAREGCFGPRSPFGLRPGGVGSRQFPVAVALAAAVAVTAVLVRRLAVRAPAGALLVAVGGLAAARSVAALWLPRVGTAPTRQHLQSIAVMLATGTLAAAWSLRRRRAGTLADGPTG